eukprot:TRINITY_DN49270_c0_g1_i3.p1 TRINITY_DN49270_c0_g1~~TRINITY_DN49270_c0_g1_i3.p1  ORF type:complete len:188 (+),score=1.60 TRINITY_DN49270_c0_g1_i3:21-584(+)
MIEGCETFFGTCSGHGQCINNSCICDDGWSGHGDLLDLSGHDCNISSTMKLIVYTFLCIANFYGVCLAIHRLRRVSLCPPENFFKSLKTQLPLKPLLLTYTAVTLSLFASLAVAISKQRVGYDVFVTLMYILIWNCIIMSLRYSCPTLLSLFITMFRFLKSGQLPILEIGRAVQQECRDRSRMPSSA